MYQAIAQLGLEEAELTIQRRELRDCTNVLKLPDAEFVQDFRVDKEIFQYIFEDIKIYMKETYYSTHLPLQLKLSTFLRFLATGSYQKLVGNKNDSFMAQTTSTEEEERERVIISMKQTLLLPTYPNAHTCGATKSAAEDSTQGGNRCGSSVMLKNLPEELSTKKWTATTEKLKFVTVLGAGLLVGTALTVIIPEGIRSLYMDTLCKTPHSQSHHMDGVKPSVTISAEQLDTFIKGADHSRTIGLSLVLGFVFMMFVEQISQHKAKEGEKNITATLGLVVHAAADGVALGAAATTSHQDVEIIVFLAIMLHKAPAAFGLVSFLLHEKIERQQIRNHLLIFSLSAPLLTLLTYFGIGQEQKETLNSVNATGIAMLFSGGTFLYVATVHVLPELTQSNSTHKHHHHNHGNQYDYRPLENNAPSVAEVSGTKGLHYSELITLICGALLPLTITFGHHH